MVAQVESAYDALAQMLLSLATYAGYVIHTMLDLPLGRKRRITQPQDDGSCGDFHL